MIKEAIQYLVSLKNNNIYNINAETYSDRELVRIAPHVDRPRQLTVNGLDSIVKLVRSEMSKENLPIYIRVESPRRIEVFTTLDGYKCRDYLYEAKCDSPDFHEGWMEFEAAIIKLRSAFVQTDDLVYLLDLLSRINKEDGVSAEDNGISQTVTTRQGVSLKQFENVRSRVALAPFRTFAEVKQPESEFILRLDDRARVGLFEADGGFWKLNAKHTIRSYFEEALKDEVINGGVIVMV